LHSSPWWMIWPSLPAQIIAAPSSVHSAHPDALPPSKCPFRDRGRH
jgi:hypothetical protein